ncbi:MAG: arsinothricin resistance N-acetyltransferase ArsN1 family B [Pseudomonadota bacterium]
MRSVKIRQALISDAEAIQAIYAPIVSSTPISFEEAPPSAAEMSGRITATLEQGYPYLVADQDGEAIAYAYAGQHRARAAYRWSVDVTIYVAEAARGAGVGKSLYEELLKQLERGEFHAAFAGIALPNPGSIALHEAVGFTHVGTYQQVGFKFDRWHDVGWWQRILVTR